MLIRPASLSDYDQLCELFDDVDELHRREQPDLFRKAEGPVRSRERIAQLIEGETGTILVAEHDLRLMGLATVWEVPSADNPLRVPRREFEINTVTVRKEARRQGIGRTLIDAALEWAKQRGATHVEISVFAFNQDALRLYVAVGFEMKVHRLMLTLPARE